MARPRATRWRWPPESCLGRRSRSAVRPRVSAAAAMRVAHVLADGHVWIERVVLEDHRDVAVFGRQIVDDAPIDGDGAGGDGLQSRDHPQRGALAAARGPHEHQELPIAHGEVKVLHGHGPIGVDLAQMLECDCRHNRGSGGVEWGERKTENGERRTENGACRREAPNLPRLQNALAGRRSGRVHYCLQPLLCHADRGIIWRPLAGRICSLFSVLWGGNAAAHEPGWTKGSPALQRGHSAGSQVTGSMCRSAKVG